MRLADCVSRFTKGLTMEKYLDKTLSVQERAEALTDAMTVEEQMSQLRFDAPAVERLGIPEYNWWNEGIHGLARSGIATVWMPLGSQEETRSLFHGLSLVLFPTATCSSQRALGESKREVRALLRCIPWRK